MSYGKNYCLNSLRQKLLPREGLGINPMSVSNVSTSCPFPLYPPPQTNFLHGKRVSMGFMRMASSYLDPPKYHRKWDTTPMKQQVLVHMFCGTLRLQVLASLSHLRSASPFVVSFGPPLPYSDVRHPSRAIPEHRKNILSCSDIGNTMAPRYDQDLGLRRTAEKQPDPSGTTPGRFWAVRAASPMAGSCLGYG